MEHETVRPDWGITAVPVKDWKYVIFNAGTGEIDYCFSGQFDALETRRLAYWNLKADKWTDYLPDDFAGGFLPLYNGMELNKRDRSLATVILFQTETEVDACEAFFREDRDKYVAVSFMPDLKRNIDLSLFASRKVLFWPEVSKKGDEWYYEMSNLISINAQAMLLANTRGWGEGFNILVALESGGATAATLAVDLAQPLVIEKPNTKINAEGFTDLRGSVPRYFIDKMKAEFGDNKGVIETEYNSVMRVIDKDPGFTHLVKTDRATNQIAFSSIYGTIDEVDNAVLNRLSLYGIKRLSRDTRFDILNTLRLREANTFNSVDNHFGRLKVKYPDPKNRIDEILDKIEYIKNDPVTRMTYREMWEVYFTRGAMHTQLAFSRPVPNDIVPVLVGPQRIGKSRFCRYLAMTENLFMDMGDKNTALGSPDSIRYVSGRLVVELGEMSSYGKTEIGAAKVFISQTVDSFRQLYERGITKVPRTANLIGTSNEWKFLKDLTGNARFFPVGVKKIDHTALFKQPEVIEETWAYYWSKVVPGNWLDLSAGTKEFFDNQTSRSVDMGVSEDLFMGVFMLLEPEYYARAVNNRYKPKRMAIPYSAFAQKYHEAYGTVPYDLSKKAQFCLTLMGYEEGRTRNETGQLVRGVSIDLTNPNLRDRMKQVRENPEEDNHDERQRINDSEGSGEERR